jgi:hypothetical protein
MKVFSSILLLFLLAGCASYHDGNRKGIFLKDETLGPAFYATWKIDVNDRKKFNSKIEKEGT